MVRCVVDNALFEMEITDITILTISDSLLYNHSSADFVIYDDMLILQVDSHCVSVLVTDGDDQI